MLLMKKVAIINNTQFNIVKRNALLGPMMPAGISLMAVRGFCASKLLSRYRLKAMAALRAVITQMMTNMNFVITVFQKIDFSFKNECS